MGSVTKPKMYIAGKIGNLPETEWRPNFEEGKRVATAMGYEPVSPTDLPHNHNRTWIDYMREDLHALIECDAIYLLRNWRDSPGAKIEAELALQLGLEIYHQAMNPKPVGA